MALTLGRVSAATVAFWVTTTISIAGLGTLGAIAVFLRMNNTTSDSPDHSLTLAAATLNIICLLAALVAACLFLLRVTRRTLLSCCACFILLAVAAAVVTIFSLAQLWNTLSQTERGDGTTTTVIQAGFAVWAICTFSQITLYAIILWPYHREESDLPASELAAQLQQVQSPKKSLSVRLASLSSPRASPLDSTLSDSIPDPMASRFSSPSISPRSSFRRSVSQAIRPMASKTRLLFRSSIISREAPSLYSARDPSTETSRPQNEFRDWDTSGALAVEQDQAQDPFVTSRSKKTRLAPIPGSRPVSPARPLDGPFKTTEVEEDSQLPDSPMASPILSHSDITYLPARPRAVSRPHSNHSHHSQEAHIHPLFRSESPNPPPVASPGTIITASAYAGQVVNSDQAYFPPARILRSAQSSRPASPSPLSPTLPLSRSRQGSARSLRLQQSSPVELRSPSALSHEAEQDG